MQDHVYKITEIVGTSGKGINEAIEAALARAAKSIHNIRWFEVGTVRGFFDGDKGIQYQVVLKIGFALVE